MGYNDYDDYEDYEYVDDDDDEYYDDDESYIDYDEEDALDDDESVSSGVRGSIRPFGGGSSGLPGSSSSGSRFGGSSGTSRFGGSGSSDKSSSSSSGTSRFGGSGSSRFGGSSSSDKSSSSSSSRFGGSGSSDKSSSSGTSRFGGSGSSRFGSSDSSDKSSSSGTSRFGGSSSSDKSSGSSSSSRFGGSGSSDKSSSSGTSRFGGSSSSKSSDKSSSSSSSSSRFGNSSSKSSDKSSSSSSSSSRFGGGNKKDDSKSSSSSPLSRFGRDSKKDDDKSKAAANDKKADKSAGSGNFLGRFGGGNKKDGDQSTKASDEKADKSAGSGNFLGRFGGGNKKDGDQSTKASDKKTNKKADSGSSSGGRFGRFGGGGKKDDTSKSSDSKSSDNKSKSSTSGRFGGGSKKESDAASTKKPARQSAFGAKKSSTDADKKGAKTAAATAKADNDGGLFGKVTGALSNVFGGSEDESSTSPSRAKAARKVPKAKTDDGLTLDNWLDIIGVGLVVGSLVLFFSAISQEQAAIGAIHEFLGDVFGWGALSVPIVMLIIGLWLIVRHFGEEAPTVDPVRMVGVVIVFITTLALFQYIDSFNYDLGNNIPNQEVLMDLLRARLEIAWDKHHSGGGRIGAQLYYTLYTTVTEIGGFFLLLFSYVIGGMLITRMSAAEIVRAAAGIVLSLREGMKTRAVQKRAERQIAAQRAAEEQARLRAAGVPVQGQTAALATAGVAPPVDASGREIRMTVGGQAQTVSMSGQQAGQVPPAIPAQNTYGPPMRAMPMQNAPQQANNGGFLGRFGFGRQAAPVTSAPPAPTELPAVPLPMDDGFSHFDPAPVRRATTPPAQVAPPMSEGGHPVNGSANASAAQAPQVAPPPSSMPQAPTASPSQTKAAPPAESAADEVSDFLQERRQRLNDLRDGKTGPLSQSAMARAKQDDLTAAFVPSSEGQREETFQSQFSTGLGERVRAEAQQVSRDDVLDDDFMRPSHLPSVQADGDTTPKQQRLSVPVEAPKSSAVQSSKQRPDWRLPDYRTLLSSGSEQEFDREYLLKQARIIEETLESFGAPGRVVEVNTGPVITQFGVEPDYVSGRSGRKQRVKVSAIAGLDKDLQLALGARSIRVEAPVPGKGYVGVEVPNAESTLVSLRDVMDSPSFSKHKTPLAIALGQSVSGAPISADLSTMPHLLIAGTTGSGKSVCVNSIIASIISRNTPEQVKFIMVDPKRVELTGYNGIPHLVAPVVVELERIVGVLKWVTREMDTRYKQFSEAGSRNIEDFNKHRDPNTTEQMSYMVVIIDELADLMMLAPEETERTITRIAALARATGIHLVIATQRPSVDVVTGLIKANFPARIAFAVAGSIDSRVILDQPGAERLLGKGDMLYLSGDSPAPLRLQGVYVSDMEINNIVRYWRMQGVKQQAAGHRSGLDLDKIAPSQPQSIPMKGSATRANNGSNDELPLFAAAKRQSEGTPDNHASEEVELTKRELTGDVKEGSEDDLYDRAVELVRRLDKASISLLQRRLRIGYTRAARLIDVMEARGVVGPAKDGSSKPRDVLPEK